MSELLLWKKAPLVGHWIQWPWPGAQDRTLRKFLTEWNMKIFSVTMQKYKNIFLLHYNRDYFCIKSVSFICRTNFFEIFLQKDLEERKKCLPLQPVSLKKCAERVHWNPEDKQQTFKRFSKIYKEKERQILLRIEREQT